MHTDRSLPTSIGFIMDGNRRWAKARGLSPIEGHEKGYEVFFRTIESLRDFDIRHAFFYAFSTENWSRPKREVMCLQSLLKKGLSEVLAHVRGEHVRVRIIGEHARFPRDIQKLMERLEMETAHYTRATISVLVSYGGRAEIVSAVNRAIVEGKQVTEDMFSTLLWSHGIPDPDLIIRTSGEERLSNFLPWQSVYSELMFTKTLWPDFGKDELQRMLEAYAERKRRIGR